MDQEQYVDEDFLRWKKEFSNTESGKVCLSYLKEEFGWLGECYSDVEEVVMENCYSAKRFSMRDKHHDLSQKPSIGVYLEERYRQADIEFYKEKDAHISEIKNIIEFMNKYTSSFSVSYIELSEKVSRRKLKERCLDNIISEIGLNNGQGFVNLLKTLLDVYAESINWRWPLVTDCQWMGHFKYGCLIYPENLKSKRHNRKPSPETLLCLSLVAIFRGVSSGNGIKAIAPYRREGKPCHTLVNMFVEATFPKSEDEDKEKNPVDARLRDNEFRKIDRLKIFLKW